MARLPVRPCGGEVGEHRTETCLRQWLLAGLVAEGVGEHPFADPFAEQLRRRLGRAECRRSGDQGQHLGHWQTGHAVAIDGVASEHHIGRSGGAMRRHEHVVESHCRAARGAHARGVPDVVDDDLVDRYEHEAGRELGLGLDRVDHHPVGVMHAGRPLPSAGHAHTTLGHGGGARGRKRSGCERERPIGREQLGACGCRELGEQPVVHHEERDGPGRRRAALPQQPCAMREWTKTEAVAAE